MVHTAIRRAHRQQDVPERKPHSYSILLHGATMPVARLFAGQPADPGSEGQSIFETLAIQTARISRGVSGTFSGSKNGSTGFGTSDTDGFGFSRGCLVAGSDSAGGGEEDAGAACRVTPHELTSTKSNMQSMPAANFGMDDFIY